jgi:26S proteasome regulatory subunit N2
MKEPDYISISQCLVHLDDFATCSNMLQDLIKKDDVLIILLKTRITF